MNVHTEGRKEISSVTWIIGLGVAVYISGLVIKSIYDLNDNGGISGFMAIGGVVAVIYFSMMSKANPGKVGRFFAGAAIFLYSMLVIPIEGVSLFMSSMSNSGAEELNQMREIKQAAKDGIEDARAEKKAYMKTMKGEGLSWSNQQANKEIANLKNEANLIIQSNQGKAFSDFSKRFGLEDFESVYRSILAALLVIALPLVLISRNGTWCGLTLLMYKAQSWSVGWLMDEKSTEIENDPAEDREDKGGEGKEPKGKPKKMGDYEGARAWVEDEFINGGYIGAEPLKKATGTTAPHQQKAIISELIKNGVVERKGKAVKKYYRTEAKQAVLSQFAKTKNFLNIVKK